MTRTAGPAGPAGPAGRSAEDNLLSGLYQQVTEQQAGSLGAAYDLTAGLARYRAWLRQRAPGADPAQGSDAGRAVEALYAQHYRALVRLASFLTGDTVAAQDLVQESLVAVHDAWGQLQDAGRALAYLRRCVVTGSRSRQARPVLARIAPGPAPGLPGPAPGRPVTGQGAADHHGPALMTGVHELPAPQREALVLRYYADLPEPEVAAVMGISRRSVRKHLARAQSALEGRLPAAS